GLLGGFDARVPCYAGGIDLDLSVEALLKQTDDNLAKGFRAIKMKVGRPDLASDVARVQAMRKHLGNGFPLMADANMKWTVEEAIRAASALQPYDLTWLEEPIIPDDIAGPHHGCRRRADCGRREPALALGVQELYRGWRGVLSRARRHQLRRRHGLHEGRAARRSVQSSGHQPRRARRYSAPSRGLPKSFLSRSARIWARSVYRAPARPRPRHGIGANPARPRNQLRLEWIGATRTMIAEAATSELATKQ